MRESERPIASSTIRRVTRPGRGTHLVNACISDKALARRGA